MRKLNCSRRSLRRSSPRSLSAFPRKSFAFMVAPSRSNLKFNKSRGHRKLHQRKPECLAGNFLAHVFFFFKQKTAYDIMPSLVGSEMCIRDSHRVELSRVAAGQYVGGHNVA